jgi:hypothetical protein
VRGSDDGRADSEDDGRAHCDSVLLEVLVLVFEAEKEQRVDDY